MDSLDVFTNVFTLNDLNIFINCLIKMALTLFENNLNTVLFIQIRSFISTFWFTVIGYFLYFVPPILPVCFVVVFVFE